MRKISYAHSKSIIDRREHCVAVGKENTILLHLDHDANDALNRHDLIASPFSQEKWEVSGNGNIYTQNSTLVVNGQDILLVSKDILEIDVEQKYYFSLSILNKNAANALFSVGTIDYMDLETEIATGRPLGATFDNWNLYNQTVPTDGKWHVISNSMILEQHYKSGTSSNPDDLHKWPENTNYAKLFIRIENLDGNEIVLRDLDFFFINESDNVIDNTPSPFIIDISGGKFGGAIDLSGKSKNLIWNGDLRFQKKRWSVGTEGIGTVFTSIETDGSYQVYFKDVRNTKDIIRISTLHNIEPSTKYTLSFYARASKEIGLRKCTIRDPSSGAIGWKYPEIIYIGQTWSKITVVQDSFASVPSNCHQLVLSQPDLLEDDTLFVYYNGMLLRRGEDFYEYSDNELYLNFTPKDDDIIKIHIKSSSNENLQVDKVIFHQQQPTGSTVSIKHIKNQNDLTEEIASEESHLINTITDYIITSSTTSDTLNKLHVYRNGILLQENDDYTTADYFGQIKIDFNNNLQVGDVIKVIFYKNILINRYNRTASAGQQDFTIPTYINDGHHLLVFRNGALVELNDDYIEQDSATIHFNYPINSGEKIILIAVDNPYEITSDKWQLSSPESEFEFTAEVFNIQRLVCVDGVLKSLDSTDEMDFYYHYLSQSEGFKYDRYDLSPLTDGQTIVALPFSYNVGQNELWVYRNGMMMTLGEDYTESSSTSLTLSTPGQTGELITVIKTEILPVGDPNSISFVREEYDAQTGLNTYKVSQEYIVGSDNLLVYLNGILLRKGFDYSEVDEHTITFNIPLQDKDNIIFLIAKTATTNVGYYIEDVYHGSDVNTGNILTTTRSLNFVQGTEATLWIKNVKLEKGDIERDSYNSGLTYSADISYYLSEPLNKYEGTLSFYISPYRVKLEDVFSIKGEVETFSDLATISASDGDIYRTRNDYKYWIYKNSNWQSINLESLSLSSDEWSLLKMEKMSDEESRYRIIYGEANDYGTLELPPLSTLQPNMVTITWSLYGAQWHQLEVESFSDLPLLSSEQSGYVYRVKNPFSYYIWLWDDITSTGSWQPKAPMATYNKYSDLPVLTAQEDGFVAKVIEEPSQYKGAVNNKTDLTPIANAYGESQQGFIWKVNSLNEYYEWNWDYFSNQGQFRKIDIAMYYQWTWDFKANLGQWLQCNKIKAYINGGKDGILTRTFREITNEPNRFTLYNASYAKYDEIRIDSIARDKTEIEIWYKSQLPFYPIGPKAAII